MFYTLMHTRWGWVGALFTEKGLRKLTFPVGSEVEAKKCLKIDDSCTSYVEATKFRELEKQLVNYFNGRPTRFDCGLDLSGSTQFQRDVWKTVADIPYGQMKSYKWVADKMGRKNACRAVGQALARNPVPIIIPCHRVIRKNGTPGGFAGKASIIDTKLKLLSLEGCKLN
ncbi:MAG: methylated-DNA--[protein]-cysteine S-methyltransferase [Dehalococcoidia bacterium]|jgi:O-6-methylguanine DNA methyltransferase